MTVFLLTFLYGAYFLSGWALNIRHQTGNGYQVTGEDVFKCAAVAVFLGPLLVLVIVACDAIADYVNARLPSQETSYCFVQMPVHTDQP